MLHLKHSGQNWEFPSEAELEDFIWSSLETLLYVSPFKRQFSINGQVCDMLAVDQNAQLSIIELKNVEDRYIVNQLTRYYDALLENQPLQENIDYSQPIRLIAIAPIFHKDNFIDRKYNNLDINFFQFQITESNYHFNFYLTDVDTNQTRTSKLEAQISSPNQLTLLQPSRRLLNLLADRSDTERQKIFEIREQILAFHDKLKEIPVNQSVLYGGTKNQPCAELRYDSVRDMIALFLWLPHQTSWKKKSKQIIARMRVWTDWKLVSDIGHVPKGLGNKVNLDELESASVRPPNKLLGSNKIKDIYFTDPSFREDWVNNIKSQSKYVTHSPHYKSGLALSIKDYFELIDQPDHSSHLLDLVTLALKTWVNKH